MLQTLFASRRQELEIMFKRKRTRFARNPLPLKIIAADYYSSTAILNEHKMFLRTFLLAHSCR